MSLRMMKKYRLCGRILKNFTKKVKPKGKATSYFNFFKSRRIFSAAYSTETIFGIRNLFMRVASVSTNPGLITDTVIPRGVSSVLKISTRFISAAFVGLYANEFGRPR